MDRLFRPWRYAYVTSERDTPGCILCDIANEDPSRDRSRLVVARRPHTFVVLNAYPYNTGHLMIVPQLHVPRITGLPIEVRAEIIELVADVERALEEVYHPDGVNFGMNLGRSAGAGIEDHLHLHAVPRWTGDTNFMTVTSESRVLPEALDDSWSRLHGRL